MDVHAASCTLAVISEKGRKLKDFPVETNGQALVEAVRMIPGHKHLVIEEGLQSAWLYETLSPHVDELVMAGITTSRGPKSDKRDAYGLAEKLRVGNLDKHVFKAPRQFSLLREFSRIHMTLVEDVVRTQARIKSVYRSRGVLVTGIDVYSPRRREEWPKQLPSNTQPRASRLYAHLDFNDDAEQKARSTPAMIGDRTHRRILEDLGRFDVSFTINVTGDYPVYAAPERAVGTTLLPCPQDRSQTSRGKLEPRESSHQSSETNSTNRILPKDSPTSSGFEQDVWMLRDWVSAPPRMSNLVSAPSRFDVVLMVTRPPTLIPELGTAETLSESFVISIQTPSASIGSPLHSSFAWLLEASAQEPPAYSKTSALGLPFSQEGGGLTTVTVAEASASQRARARGPLVETREPRLGPRIKPGRASKCRRIPVLLCGQGASSIFDRESTSPHLCLQPLREKSRGGLCRTRTPARTRRPLPVSRALRRSIRRSRIRRRPVAIAQLPRTTVQ